MGLTFWVAVGLAVAGLAAMAREPRKWTAEDIAAEKRWRAAMLTERRCPDSGLPLGEDDDTRFRCRICDCPGYEPKEVGGGSSAGS